MTEVKVLSILVMKKKINSFLKLQDIQTVTLKRYRSVGQVTSLRRGVC